LTKKQEEMIVIMITFLIGLLGGFAAAVLLLLSFLSVISPSSSDIQVASEVKQQTDLKEETPSEESKKLLQDAVRNLINLQSGRHDDPFQTIESDETPNMTLYQLEKAFQECCNSSKDRAKQLKLLSSFISDTGKLYATFAKDLNKLSVSVKSYIKTLDIVLPIDGNKDVDSHKGGATYIDEWWMALSSCLEHISDDNQVLADVMSGECSSQIILISEEQMLEEKRLNVEGNTLLTLLKESLMKNESLEKERDKWRSKVSSAHQVPSNVPVIGGMAIRQSEEEVLCTDAIISTIIITVTKVTIIIILLIFMNVLIIVIFRL
jgi:hypothetical protein